MKFSKDDKVCALLIANKWGIDFTCFVGKLVKVEKSPANTVAHIEVTRYIGLLSTQRHKPTLFKLDIRLFKLLHWNPDTKEKVKELRNVSRTLHQLTREIKPA
jgi:hypothetical protein